MNARKKILIVTFSQGGPFVWAQNLAKYLEKNGYAVTLASGRKEYFKQQFKYYDIVHSCVAVPNLLCKKYILTIHGNFYKEKIIARPLFWLMLKRADQITVPSEYLKNTLAIKNSAVIPNGIDMTEKTKESYALIGEKPVVGILTNFNFRLKADGLIHLAKIVQAISPEIKIVVGGSGEFIEEYKKEILKIHPNTEFLGHCKKEDLFHQIDIFTYYSILDNQPIAVLEAMAFSLPVVSNIVGSIEEVLTGEMAKYIARTDEDYHKILRTLLDSQTAREENGKAAKEIARDFSWDKIVRRFIEIYEK